MFVLDLLLFAQRVNSNLNPGKRGGERYEKEIEKNFHNFGVLMSIFFGKPDL